MLWALEQKIFPLENFWKNKKENILDTIDSILKVCHKVMLPIISYECKRPISAIRWLSNYLRCTMGNKRLSSLSLCTYIMTKLLKLMKLLNCSVRNNLDDGTFMPFWSDIFKRYYLMIFFNDIFKSYFELKILSDIS